MFRQNGAPAAVAHGGDNDEEDAQLAPRFTMAPSAPGGSGGFAEIVVTEGDPVRIGCRVTGRPPPEIQWFRLSSDYQPNNGLLIFCHQLRNTSMPVLIFVMEEGYRYAESNKINSFEKKVVPHNFFGHFLRVEKKILNLQ